MLENFRGLKIKGRCFENETTLEFFKNDKQRVSVVYGRNGSGKTTVSKIFEGLKSGSILDGMTTVETIPTPPDSNNGSSFAKSLSIFNDAYIKEKLSLQPDADGIGTIVLLGKQAELDAQIKAKESELSEKQKQQTAIIEQEQKFCDESSPLSPLYYKKRIKTRMKGSQAQWGWCHRQKMINYPKPSMPSARDEMIEAVCNIETTLDVETCRVELKEGIKKLHNLAKIPKGAILPKIEIGQELDFDEIAFVDLLNTKVEAPIASERDKQLVLDVIKRIGRSWAVGIVDHFSDESVDVCPYCFRGISPTEKSNVIDAIESVLSTRVDMYEKRLLNFYLPNVVPYDLSAYADIESDLVRDITGLFKELSDCINSYRTDATQRLNKIYATPNFSIRSYNILVSELKDKLSKLDAVRKEYEELRNEPEKLRERLNILNFQMSHYESEDDIKEYKKRQKDAKHNLDKKLVLEDAVKALNADIIKLENQKKNITIAADRINKALSYIFLSDKRIQLVPEGSVYKIEINGNPVKPIDISIGERNALALCYFFTDIMAGCEADTSYNKERLIVLDDPVSSFDHENKMGVLSYILFEIENLTCTTFKKDDQEVRTETRVICLMHELYSLMTLSSNIFARDKATKKLRMLPQIFQLNSKLNKMDVLVKDRYEFEAINEYSKNFEEIIAYAIKEIPADDVHVGNQTRRLMEAFSTFVYREGFEHLYFGELIKGFGSEEDVKALNQHFKNLCSRFVINDESHLQGHVRSLTNHNALLPFISATDRQRAVRESICLLYLISSDHINSLTKDANLRTQREETINKWIGEMLATVKSKGSITP